MANAAAYRNMFTKLNEDERREGGEKGIVEDDNQFSAASMKRKYTKHLRAIESRIHDMQKGK